jgi:hypothetical protein
MADESRDVGGHEHLSVVARVVSSPSNTMSNKNEVIQEYFLGLVRLHEFDAITLCDAIVQFLNLHQIDLKSCIGVCFDG